MINKFAIKTFANYVNYNKKWFLICNSRVQFLKMFKLNKHFFQNLKNCSFSVLVL